MILKFNKERIKQIILSCIAFSLILVGYLNYNYDQNNSIEVSSRTRNDINLGDVELVNSEPIENSGAIVSNAELDISNQIVDRKSVV